MDNSINTVKALKNLSLELIQLLSDNNLQSIIDDLSNSEGSTDYYDLSLEDRSKISYLKGDRIPEDKSLVYCHLYRKGKAYHGKIGKLLSSKVPQADIQKVSAILSARASKDKIVISDKIKYYYHEDNYSKESEGGSLYSSCMRYESCQDYIEFYETVLKDYCKIMLILDNEGKVKARAIYWQGVYCKELDSKVDYLDRIYSIDDNLNQIFLDYAKSKGIKVYKNYERLSLSVKVIIPEDIPLPYMDSFQYYNYNNLNNRSGEYSLSNTNGEPLQNPNLCQCDNCNNEYDSECEGGYSEADSMSLCEDCLVIVNGEAYSKDSDSIIEINNTWYLKESDEIVYSNSDSEYYLLDDCVYSEYHESFILAEDSFRIESKEDYYLNSDIIKDSEGRLSLYNIGEIVNIEGEYYLIEDCIKFKGEYFLKDNDSIIEINGEYFHKESDSIIFDSKDNTWKVSQLSIL